MRSTWFPTSWPGVTFLRAARVCRGTYPLKMPLNLCTVERVWQEISVMYLRLKAEIILNNFLTFIRIVIHVAGTRHMAPQIDHDLLLVCRISERRCVWSKVKAGCNSAIMQMRWRMRMSPTHALNSSLAWPVWI